MSDEAPVNVEAPKNLRQKLAAIRREIHNVEKAGENTFHKYKYVMASDVQGVIGTALAEQGIALGRRNLTVERGLCDNGETWVMVQCEYGLLDENGEELWYASAGEGRDKGDKGIFKAWTGCFKYFLIQAFSLAMGDDPEADGDEEREKGRGKPNAKADGGGAARTPPADDFLDDSRGNIDLVLPSDVSKMCDRLTEAVGRFGEKLVAARLASWGLKVAGLSFGDLGRLATADEALREAVETIPPAKFGGYLKMIEEKLAAK